MKNEEVMELEGERKITGGEGEVGWGGGGSRGGGKRVEQGGRRKFRVRFHWTPPIVFG